MPAKSAAQQRFWVNTISLEHVELGVAGGFTQADHGKDTRLRRLTVGDGIVFHSPRTAMRAGQPLQQFTAIGTITGNEPYQVTMSQDFRPWRLAVQFRPCTAVAAKPLVPQLSFAADPVHWGMVFRRGLFAIPEVDFTTIAAEMTPPG